MPVQSIEDANSIGMPLLGYTVIASLKGVEVTHDDLLSLLTPMGFGQYLPALVEPRTALRRAIREWIKELSGVFSGKEDESTKTKQLVREINSKKKNELVMVLVIEEGDLETLDLSYLKDLQIFLDKKTQELTSLRTVSTRPKPMADWELLDKLVPHYERYAQLHTAGDLSRMIADIISSMNAQALRGNGGVYFVPYDQRYQLVLLKELIEEKLPGPADGSNQSSLLHLPIVDTQNAKAQLSGATHAAFLSDLETLAKNLQRFIEQSKNGKVKPESIAARLVQYQEMKAKVELYHRVLGMYQSEIISKLEDLEQNARRLLQVPTDVVIDTDPPPGTTIPTSTV